MPVTRVFRSGNSQAVRSPAELAYDDRNVDLGITRQGDVLVIAPIRPLMKDVIAELKAIPKPTDVEPYEPVQLLDREQPPSGLFARHEYHHSRP